jgi:hypothetical protein
MLNCNAVPVQLVLNDPAIHSVLFLNCVIWNSITCKRTELCMYVRSILPCIYTDM